MNMKAKLPEDEVEGGEPGSPPVVSAHAKVGTDERPGVLHGILAMSCPECRRGKVFANLFLKMNPTCPACGLKFEREPGYFLGAMYFSYAMAIPPLTAMTLLQKWRSPERSMASCIVVSAIVFIPLVVPIVRFSRVLWLYFDRFFDPQDRQSPDSKSN